MSEAAISIRDLSMVFGRDEHDRHVAVEHLDLDIRDGEFFCLLGPSGCGKTTLLHLIAGFESPTSGTVNVFNEPVTGPGSDRGVVFQSEIALFNWLTVQENIEFGLKVRGVRSEERKAAVERNLDMVGLSPYRGRFPFELSGGMKQRVQIARVLANDPRVLLLDEPFAALDAQTRRHLQRELVSIWSHTSKTALFVTHDIAESVLLADRVGVMTRGPRSTIKRIVEIDLPRPRSGELTERFVELHNLLAAEIEGEIPAGAA